MTLQTVSNLVQSHQTLEKLWLFIGLFNRGFFQAIKDNTVSTVWRERRG